MRALEIKLIQDKIIGFLGGPFWLWKMYLANLIMYYKSKERRDVELYIGNMFCMFLKSNKFTGMLM